MKAWELIKHLEDGGEIMWKHQNAVQVRSLKGSPPNYDNLMLAPNEYEIIKAKKKIKLYAFHDPRKGSNLHGLYWCQIEVSGHNHIRVPSEDKEIEIEEET